MGVQLSGFRQLKASVFAVGGILGRVAVKGFVGLAL